MHASELHKRVLPNYALEKMDMTKSAACDRMLVRGINELRHCNIFVKAA